MTPAVTALRKAGVPFETHEYEVDETAASVGEDAAEALGVDPDLVFKTLVVACETGDLALALLPASARYDRRSLARALGVKRAWMAERRDAERATDGVVGGISPLGLKRRFATVIDRSAADHERIYLNGGRRGLMISLAPDDLARVTSARMATLVGE